MLNELRNRNTLVIAGAALVVGVIVGWLALGWWLFPVEYKDGNPPGLAAKYKSDYLQMVADSYAIDQDTAAAQRRLLGFDKQETAQLLAQMKSDLQAARKDAQAARIQRLADGLAITLAASLTPVPGSTVAPVSTLPAIPTSVAQQTQSSSSSLPLGLIIGALGLVFILAGAGGILYLTTMRRNVAPAARPMAASAPSAPVDVPVVSAGRRRPEPAGPKTGVSSPSTQSSAPSLGNFVTTYKLGDDGYDTSFGIELPTGEFLGECGVGISDVVGEGPQKVTAFEVWLFDKNDIKTVTKVLMSDYAYNNEIIRKKLMARGDAVLATPGQDLTLETEALRVRAVVSNMDYGSGGMPQSFFNTLSIELAPTVKNRVTT